MKVSVVVPSKAVEKVCSSYGLPCVVIKQDRGFFTTALNIGKRHVRGDIVLFTDDDAIILSYIAGSLGRGLNHR